jgi:hypothetical protein
MSFFQNCDFLSILEKTQIDFRAVFIIFSLDLSDCKALYSDRYFTKTAEFLRFNRLVGDFPLK